MSKESVIPRIITTSAVIGVIGLISQCGITRRQRRWVINRDDGHCQQPTETGGGRLEPCTLDEDDGLEVHHVKPSRWAKMLGLDQDNEVDRPENLITLCKEHHHDVHPDIPRALSDYGKQKKAGVEKPTSFFDTFKKRNEQVERGEKYWEDENDEAFSEIARNRTDEADTPYPPRNRRGTENRPARKWFKGLFD